MTDSRVKGRVKGLFGGTSPDGEQLDQAPVYSSPDPQHQALQVLVLAQRTADEHVGTAQHQADKIRADARAAAEQIVRDAQGHADGVRREAGKALADARDKAEQLARNAQAQADAAQRDAKKVMSDARARAEEIANTAQANADALEREAQQRYQDTVGSLAAKCSALQQQIDALQQYDREYRNRLRTFMQGQLRALGVEDPPPDETRHPAVAETAAPPAQDSVTDLGSDQHPAAKPALKSDARAAARGNG